MGKIVSYMYMHTNVMDSFCFSLLKVWDLRKIYTVHKKEPIAKHLMNYSGISTRNGFSSLLICPAKITLYASCMDNIIYAYNISSYNRKPGKFLFFKM